MDGEVIKNLGSDAGSEPVFRAADPVISPQPYASPADFAAQYPQPLDTTEILALCEEVSLLAMIPEIRTSLKSELWREMTSLALSSGSSNALSFADGACPEEYTHDGANKQVDIKNLGVKKALSIRDIMHSQAVASANWNGINTLVGGPASGAGLPGASDMGTFQRQVVSNVKEKEMRLGSTLLLNGLDAMLVNGDHVDNSLEFTGIEKWSTNNSVTFHTNVNTASGSLSAVDFDRWLAEACGKPTHIFGHPQAIQELMSAYFQLGYQGSQLVNFNSGDRITPGFNFGSYINTGVGRLQVVADTNFRRNAAGSTTMQADLWALRMTHNGEPLVYRATQIPVSVNDLVPGCTAVSFQIWTATALVIKGACFHGKYTTQITGRIVSTCTVI
jgi:hypothetical protein